jgi:hypothetical protein
MVLRCVLPVLGATTLGSFASAEVVSFSRTFHNTTSSVQAYEYSVSVPLAGPRGSMFMAGTVTASLIDLNGNGAFIRTANQSPVYSAAIDQSVVHSLWLPGWSHSVGGFVSGAADPARFSRVPINVASDPMGTMQVTLRFELSPRDMATIGAMFEVAPIPGPAAWMGLVLLHVPGRRRMDSG